MSNICSYRDFTPNELTVSHTVTVSFNSAHIRAVSANSTANRHPVDISVDGSVYDA